MKRWFSLLLLISLLCVLALPAAADVAYMPRDNFIEKHWDDCSYLSRWFWTDGEAGYVLAHKTPDSKAATPLPNGGKYYISNVYKDRWGVLEYDPDTLENSLQKGSVSGWVDMREMVPDYDADAFYADHRGEFADGTVDLELKSDAVVCAYKYPGSGICTEELSGGWWGSGEVLTLNTIFTDPAGRRWGYCGYFYGHRNLWICIDDPANSALPPDENCVTVVTRPAAAPEPDPTEAPAPAESPAPGKTIEVTPPADDTTLQQAAKANRGSGPYIAAGAGGVVIVAAAVLFAALRKRWK